MVPIEIHVRVSPDDELQALRARVKVLEAKLEGESARAEYKYRCEVVVNGELVDLCRANGIRFREALKERPW